MRKIIVPLVIALVGGASVLSCSDSVSYSELQEDERDAIKRFIDLQDIKVISESEFEAQDSTTDVSQNEFVYFSNSRVYMQIEDKGGGEPMEDGDRFSVLVRYLEQRIGDEGETDTLSYNNLSGYPYPDEMIVMKTDGTYSATFTSTGAMYSTYGSAYVPTGWLVPFDYIRVGRPIADRAKLKLIVPHTEGHSDASSYVYACYYELTFQLGQ